MLPSGPQAVGRAVVETHWYSDRVRSCGSWLSAGRCQDKRPPTFARNDQSGKRIGRPAVELSWLRIEPCPRLAPLR